MFIRRSSYKTTEKNKIKKNLGKETKHAARGVEERGKWHLVYLASSPQLNKLQMIAELHFDNIITKLLELMPMLTEWWRPLEERHWY